MVYSHTDEAHRLKLRLRGNQGRRKRFRPVRDRQVQAQRRDGHQRLPRGECTYSPVGCSRKQIRIDNTSSIGVIAQWLECTSAILKSEVRCLLGTVFLSSLPNTSLAPIHHFPAIENVNRYKSINQSFCGTKGPNEHAQLTTHTHSKQ